MTEEKIVQPMSVILVATWFALLTSVGELTILAGKKYLLHKPILFGMDVIWMAPLAILILFMLVAFILILIGRLRPRFNSTFVVILIFAFLASLSLFFMVGFLHKFAALLLAAGLSAQIARMASSHPQKFWSLILIGTGWLAHLKRRGEANLFESPKGDPDTNNLITRRQFLLTSGAAIAGLTIGVRGWEKLAESNKLAKLPPSSKNQPNVLLIVLDTVRAANLSLLGYARKTTPNLDRLAKNGVSFERAISTAPWTLPSHASMFTGRWHHELSVDWEAPLDDKYPTLAEILSLNGYTTAGFSANLIYCNRESGLDRGFAHFEDYPVSPAQLLLSSSLGRTVANDRRVRDFINNSNILARKSAEELTNDFLRWLSNHETGPFFAFLNFFDAHEPYLPPAPFDTLFGSTSERRNSFISNRTHSASRDKKWEMTPQQIEAEIVAYDGSIAYLDHQLGRLFDRLQDMGQLENTMAIVLADHGEEFGEHGVFEHANSLYLPSLHVPLTATFPQKIPAGLKIASPVTLRDLPATIVDAIGLDSQGIFPGNSLAPYWESPQNQKSFPQRTILSEVTAGLDAPDWYPTAAGPISSLVMEQYHYILNSDGREELYDVVDDYWETNDLAASTDHRPIIDQFRETIPPAIIP